MITLLHEARDERRFGGKAAQLAASLGAGLPVPTGIALDVEAVEAIVAGVVLPELVLLAEGPVAVRSSAVGEDGATASFAGQHATILGARTPADVATAVKQIHASARTPAARKYREKMGVPGEPRIAVVVQAMIDADCAGVLFTRHPVTGADERLIEGAWGLGEAVVAGLVDPDRARVDRQRRVLESSAGDKPIAIRLAQTGLTEEVAVEEHLRERSCLDEKTLDALCSLAEHCERVWDSPHDIEWAVHRERVWLLQRRPITSRP